MHNVQFNTIKKLIYVILYYYKEKAADFSLITFQSV